MEKLQRKLRKNAQQSGISNSFYLEQEINVPDRNQDVREVIFSLGKAKIEEVKKVENYVRVKGLLQYEILCAASASGCQMECIKGTLPFEEMVYTEEKPFQHIFVDVTGVEVSTTLIHSRKLFLKGMVELEVFSEEEKEETITVDVIEEDGVLKKHGEESLLNFVKAGKDLCHINEQVVLPGTKENIERLIWREAESRKMDTRLQENEIHIRGEIQLFCIYMSPDGKMDWFRQLIPYEGKFDCPGATEGMYHTLHTEWKEETVEIGVDEDGEPRVLVIKGALLGQWALYEEHTWELLEDLYSPGKHCQIVKKELPVESMVLQNHSKCKMKETLELPELKEEMLQICHYSGFLQVEEKKLTEEGVQIEGILHLNLFYIRSNDIVPIGVWRGMIPFLHTIPWKGDLEQVEWKMTSFLEQLNVGLLGGNEIEIKGVLSFSLFLKKRKWIQNIEEIHVEELTREEVEKMPGIIGYTVKKGDSLWELAKKFHTTKERILEMNSMKSEWTEGEKILIFKGDLDIL